MRYYFEHKDENIDSIVRAAFPDYTGRTVHVSTEVPDSLDSYWCDGSRNYFVFYQMDGGKVLPVQSNHPLFEPGRPSRLGGALPHGILLVEHSIFSGKDIGITIYVNPDDITPLLPPPDRLELTAAELTALRFTCSYIPSARYEEARRDTGITRQEWDQAKASLSEKKLLSKSGAITPKGRNYLSMHPNED